MIKNVHERTYPVPASTMAPLLDRIAEPGNPLWPTEKWPPLVLDRPLGAGADGGHGPIRYTCTAYEPGRRVEFTFKPPTGLDGTHTFILTDNGDGTCALRHELIGTAPGLNRIMWAIAIRWMHDALLEGLLDKAAHAVDHPPARPFIWPVWTRLVYRVFGLLQKKGARV
ncbi:hypothetical protein EV193_108181 [Herbihabitans rhizosphaerae]|uniref:Polyketide cyclase/dehydrase/lipid transport protein n=1 Tax=Herbihabitans rhizosphaerae TaxID=1872711 RepID=A0A4Q7KHR5_9PSEU|nr:SRPBCC family protein [Herbihabitans rhizosphaerae]RZS34832.1 hypothetical protein EV193_108181 [Herbihabitans rhizosphaerae]